MDESTALAIGRAFARVLGRLRSKRPAELRVGLGRDMRLTAPAMAAAVREGLVAEGVTVLDAGMVATEMLYQLVGSRELDGGAMVTASHNPKAYTGIKLVREGALPLSGDAGIGDVRHEIAAGLGEAPGAGRVEEVDIWDEYRRKVLSFIDPSSVKPMVVVVDGGNGMGGPMIGPILEQLPLELERMYFEPDGEFPDHEPNPLLEENRRLIIERVRSSGADLGIAWDGDADRCFFIDGNGEFCDGDFVCALLARAALAKNPGAMILYDPRSSRAVPDLIAADGGRSGLSRVGHAFFKQRMREEQAVFGGEVSGHYYFRDFWNADSGTIPALLMLELLSRDGRTLAELMSDFRSRYFISGEINSEVAEPEAKLEEVVDRFGDGAVLAYLDGVSVDFPDWHFNVRPSNTEPLLRLNLESLVSREDMEAKRDALLGVIRA
jgi:phosphomannomutase